MSSHPYVEGNLPAAPIVTNRIPNSPVQMRAPHQVSLPYAGIALAPPSFPSRPGSSILIDCALKGPQNAENHARRWSDKEKSTNQWRRGSFVPYPATIAD